MIERGELAGEVVGLVIGGRRRADQPDVLGRAGEGREQRHGSSLPCATCFTLRPTASWSARNSESNVPRSAIAAVSR